MCAMNFAGCCGELCSSARTSGPQVFEAFGRVGAGQETRNEAVRGSPPGCVGSFQNSSCQFRRLDAQLFCSTQHLLKFRIFPARKLDAKRLQGVLKTNLIFNLFKKNHLPARREGETDKLRALAPSTCLWIASQVPGLNECYEQSGLDVRGLRCAFGHVRTKFQHYMCQPNPIVYSDLMNSSKSILALPGPQYSCDYERDGLLVAGQRVRLVQEGGQVCCSMRQLVHWMPVY
jgi:hypothetical protein